MQQDFLIENISFISLKTKGFSRETEALILIGGGETRTLVLNGVHRNVYMLSAFFMSKSCWKAQVTWDLLASLFLESAVWKRYLAPHTKYITTAPLPLVMERAIEHRRPLGLKQPLAPILRPLLVQ